MHNPWVSHASGDTPSEGATGVQPGSLTLRWRVFTIPAGRGVSACEDRFARAANTAFSELRVSDDGEPMDAVFLDSGSAFRGESARSFLAFSSRADSFSAESSPAESFSADSFQDARSSGEGFFAALRSQLQRIRVPREFPRQLTGGFALGWVGAFGYELKNLSGDVRASDTARGARALRHPSHPDAALLLADRGLVFSPQDGAVIALALDALGAPAGKPGSAGSASRSERWFAELEERFGPGLARLFDQPQAAAPADAGAADPSGATASTTGAPPARAGLATGAEYRLDHGHEQYLANVRACQEHIAAGDSYELCLTTTARGPALAEPWPTYQQLRTTSPVPYGAYLQFPSVGPAGLHVLSASPERFLSVQRARPTGAEAPGEDPASTLVVEAKPIKGTRPRGTGADDERWRRELKDSEKDRAENLMIVDLLRNDLAKICRPGTVRVPRLFDVESYSHVHQLVSTITGELDARGGADAVDCLAACFPGGSMTGAPKVRSMELLEEIEGHARGLYSGAIGWLSPTGEADLSITIRTLIDDGRESSFGVGGAIVTDSDPEGEWQEILVKASALLDALGARIVEDPA